MSTNLEPNKTGTKPVSAKSETNFAHVSTLPPPAKSGPATSSAPLTGALTGEITITNTKVEHARHCFALQQVCFPTLAPEEWITEAQIQNHIRLFSEGQFVAIHQPTGRVVGMTAGFRTHFDFAHTHGHTYLDFTSNCWFTKHNPRGSYYYGADMSVHPEFRGLGIARKFHDARKAMCKRLGLKGQVVCGMMPGYAEHKGTMPPERYVRQVFTGSLYDSTLTTQLRNGFRPHKLIAGYVQDAPTNGWAVLLEWRNPDYVNFHLPQTYAEYAAQSKWEKGL